MGGCFGEMRRGYRFRRKMGKTHKEIVTGIFEEGDQSLTRDEKLQRLKERWLKAVRAWFGEE